VVIVLWRAGLRISEALALSETHLDRDRGALLVVTARAISAARSEWTAGRGRSWSRGSICAQPCRSDACSVSCADRPAALARACALGSATRRRARRAPRGARCTVRRAGAPAPTRSARPSGRLTESRRIRPMSGQRGNGGCGARPPIQLALGRVESSVGGSGVGS
jgi:hypothetical protein